MFRVLPVALVALLALAVAADAAPKKTKLVELRVEGDGETLDEGTWYATGAQEIKGARKPNCRRRPRATRFPGASAMTVLGRAQLSNPALDPVRTRPTDFGPQVCQAGDVKSFGVYPSANAGFLYHVNYESGFSSADLAKVKDGDSVLWHYSVFGSDPPEAGDPPPVNTGCALQLHDVPAQDDDGEFTVRVTAHGFGCQSTDAGVTIAGADVSSPTGAGLYDVSVGDGTTELYAERGQDVRSNRYSACVGEAAQCPDAHGRTIVGSKKADGLSGTAGFDAVRAAGGDDLVNLRQGGRDRANCGGGDDVVRLKRGDGDDRVRGNCERIRRS